MTVIYLRPQQSSGFLIAFRKIVPFDLVKNKFEPKGMTDTLNLREKAILISEIYIFRRALQFLRSVFNEFPAVNYI